ncbi:hypothetical protein B0A48_17290 [Cryoendolithus antarcticus]|uniref:Uncharacterized protein n=1 Tax=Cryoendolithus antarcticus TaxID=1507870 RepID=A0A1V8SCJ4_9PEZI|nr:hypothetical protein B0A48_17290 [Cryoendolithus antarcticus]
MWAHMSADERADIDPPTEDEESDEEVEEYEVMEDDEDSEKEDDMMHETDVMQRDSKHAVATVTFRFSVCPISRTAMATSAAQAQVSGIIPNELFGMIMEQCIKDHPIRSINGKIELSYLAFVLTGPGFSQLFAERFARVGLLDALEEKLRSLPRVREYHVRVDVLENFTRHGRKAGLVLRAHTCASSDRTKTEHDPTESLENIQTADSMDSLVQRFMQTMDIEQGQKLDWDSDNDDDYDEDREAFYQDHGESGGEEEIDSDESDTDSDDDEVTEAEEMLERFEWAGGHVELDYWE